MVLFISYTPVNCNDTSGEWFLNYVAFGFQIELSAGPISGGVEFVITTDLKNVYVFTYLGLSISTLNPDTLKKIIIEGVKEILSNPKKLLKLFSFSLSICIFCVWRKWKKSFDPEAYAGGAKGAYVCVPTGIPMLSIKSYIGNTSQYLIIGLGASTSGLGYGVVPSQYFDKTAEFNHIIEAVRSQFSTIKGLASNVG